MARIVLVVAVWVVFVGGLALYMDRRDAGAASLPTAIRPVTAEGRYVVEVTASFMAAPDPFALITDENERPAALMVRLNGQEVLRISDRLEGGRPVRVEQAEGAVVGTNEIYVEASPPTDQSDRRHFVLVRVLRDEAPIADEVLWSEGGARVAGSLRFEIAPTDGESAHEP